MTEEKRNETIALLAEMVKNQKNNYKNLIRVFIIVFVIYTLLFAFVVCMFFNYESQFEYAETYTYSEEVEQEASGENATINNVEGNQYNDNAVHNEGK